MPVCSVRRVLELVLGGLGMDLHSSDHLAQLCSLPTAEFPHKQSKLILRCSGKVHCTLHAATNVSRLGGQGRQSSRSPYTWVLRKSRHTQTAVWTQTTFTHRACRGALSCSASTVYTGKKKMTMTDWTSPCRSKLPLTIVAIWKAAHPLGRCLSEELLRQAGSWPPGWCAWESHSSCALGWCLFVSLHRSLCWWHFAFPKMKPSSMNKLHWVTAKKYN